MLIPLALGAAALAYLAFSSKGQNEPMPASNVSPDLAQAITNAVASPNMAEKLRVHDLILQSPQAGEPQMEIARQMLANQITQSAPLPVIGPQTRREYRLQLQTLFSDGTRKYVVFSSTGTKILAFRQHLGDVSSRQNLGGPEGVDSALVAAARKDFGLG